MENPFQYGGIVRGDHFADRKDEIDELRREMENRNRVFLVSPRRFGKTCLLLNLLDSLEREGFACAYIDLYAFPDIRSFAGAAALLTSQALETNRDRLLKIFSGFQRLRPRVSVDANGSVSAGVEMAAGEAEPLPALLEALAHAESLAQKKKRKLVVVIDEFSDLEKYNGRTVEKALRSEIQRQRHVGYIFSGSEQSVMLAMIRDRNRAFYKLGRIMELGPIQRPAYTAFVRRWLERGGYAIDPEGLDRLFEIGADVPYNIQRLCHVMWDAAAITRKIDSSLVEKLPLTIARQDSPHCETLWRSATQPQKTLLIALARDPAEKPFSKAFQMRHGIGPSSSIKASLDSLVKKGVLHRTLEGQYRFVDLFLPYWINDMSTKGSGSE